MPKNKTKPSEKGVTFTIPESGHAYTAVANWFQVSIDGPFIAFDFAYSYNSELINPIRILLQISHAHTRIDAFAQFLANTGESASPVNFPSSGFSPKIAVQASHMDAGRSGTIGDLDFCHFPTCPTNRRINGDAKDSVQALPVARVTMESSLLLSCIAKFLELITEES
jgi:hypothetical protein